MAYSRGSGVPATRLIVNADDFGVDLAVNEAVEQAFTTGILTSASLMMGTPATADAVARARRLKGLAVGLHVTIADGRPVAPASNVTLLVGPDDRFIDNLAWAGLRWFASSRVQSQLADEIAAQFEAFAATGLVLDHVNVHKHLHIHPTITPMIISIGRRFGLLAMRIPDEPGDVIRRAEPDRLIPRAWDRPLLGLMRRRAAARRLLVNDRVFGLAWSGAMTEARLLALIPLLPPGLNELYTHPATADAADMPHAVSTYRYRDELAALISPRVRAALTENAVRLTRYSAEL